MLDTEGEIIRLHVKWVPYHHGMERPKVTGGGGLHMWRVVANILSK
jgi:hypothetical protein